MVKDLRDTHKQDVKTQASLLKTQSNLMKSIDNLTNQVADLTTQNKSLQQKVNDLLSQISVGNKVRFGSKSQKGIKKNAGLRGWTAYPCNNYWNKKSEEISISVTLRSEQREADNTNFTTIPRL